MARKIIILESNPVTAGEIAFRYAMCADVPAARQTRYADATLESQVVGATAGELTALRNGSVVEKVEEARFGASTVPAVQALLITRYQAFQAQITADNRWQRYGTSWDGTSWTAVSNA